ncbi:MAG TPA: hypothetical protein VMX94_06390 [Armatimonadota bacterium]|nr:hypothetical protein [Armatimonadota bacterium]
MPTSRIGTRITSRLQTADCGLQSIFAGFTTIELMVVLIVMVVMSSVVVVSMGPVLRESRLRSGCRMVVSALNYARSYAITNRTYTRVLFDNAKNAVSVHAYAVEQTGEGLMRPVTTPSGRLRRLPRGIQIAHISKPGVEEEERWVSFTELGRSEKAAITVADEQGKVRTVSVDAITGRCAIGASLGE